MPLWHYIYPIQSIIVYIALLPSPSLNHEEQSGKKNLECQPLKKRLWHYIALLEIII